MTSAPDSTADRCYRHPDRQSFILCQRCGRTICPQCQTQAAVGVHCPECVKEGRAGVRRPKPAVISAFGRGTHQPVATYTIMAITVLVYLLQLVSNGAVDRIGTYYPPLTLVEPWTMITAVFLHGSPLHILFNMFSLFIFGPILEQMLGRARFVALYLISGFGGSVAVLLLAPMTGVLGASGAIFGLMGAFFVIQRRLGGNNVQILVVIGINLVSGFILPGVSWQAHVGGVITGALVALVYVRTRHRRQRALQIGLVAAVVAALIALSWARIFVF